MRIERGRHTFGELKVLVAPFVELEPDDIDEVVVIVTGKCPTCDEHHGLRAATTIEDFTRYVTLLNEVINRIVMEIS